MFDYSGDIALNAVVLNVLHVVEYMDNNGAIYKIDLSHGMDDGPMTSGKGFELAQYANFLTMVPYFEEMIHDHCHYCEEEDDDDGEEPQPAIV